MEINSEKPAHDNSSHRDNRDTYYLRGSVPSLDVGPIRKHRQAAGSGSKQRRVGRVRGHYAWRRNWAGEQTQRKRRTAVQLRRRGSGAGRSGKRYLLHGNNHSWKLLGKRCYADGRKAKEDGAGVWNEPRQKLHRQQTQRYRAEQDTDERFGRSYKDLLRNSLRPAYRHRRFAKLGGWRHGRAGGRPQPDLRRQQEDNQKSEKARRKHSYL